LAIKLQNRAFLTIQLSELFVFSHLVVLIGGFAYMDDTWQWDLFFPLLFSLSSLSFSLLLMAVGVDTCGAPRSLQRRKLLLVAPCATIGCRLR